MKYLVMMLICSASLLNGYAQKQKKNEIPDAVKSAFAVKFPQVPKTEWSVEKPGEFEAEFKLNGTETSVLFDSNGNLLETEVEIKESKLPQAVKTSIAKDFPGYKLDETEKVTDTKGNVTYETEAKKGKDKFEISFDPNGKLLKKEALKSEDKD